MSPAIPAVTTRRWAAAGPVTNALFLGNSEGTAVDGLIPSFGTTAVTLAAVVDAVPVRVLVPLPEAETLPDPDTEVALGLTPIVVSSCSDVVGLAVPDYYMPVS